MTGYELLQALVALEDRLSDTVYIEADGWSVRVVDVGCAGSYSLGDIVIGLDDKVIRMDHHEEKLEELREELEEGGDG